MRFKDALSGPELSAIAEFKRRSPSMGDIRPDARIEEIVPAYARGGASAISVLVDERFAGTVDDLRAARAVTDLPLLAKGFFSTEEHLRELREAGADAALLILRDLDDETTTRLVDYAADIGLDTLVEAHDREELRRAMRLGDDVIGVNARDLSTFAIDREEQLRLVALAEADVVIAESAVHSRAQAAEAELAGATAVLVGTSLMQAPDPETKLRDLISRPLVKVCGLTRQEDVDVAVEAGADLVGFVLARETPRRAPGVLEVPETILSVAVFVEDVVETPADLIQLYRRENGHRSRDGVLGRNSPSNSLLLAERPSARVMDLPWGEDDPEHLERAAAVDGRVMLAGGLSPENVRAAIDAVRPWAVDASSSLETAPGIKDHARVRAFVEAARC